MSSDRADELLAQRIYSAQMAIQNGIGYRNAAHRYNIPNSMLFNAVRKHSSGDPPRPVGSTMLSAVEERNILQMLIQYAGPAASQLDLMSLLLLSSIAPASICRYNAAFPLHGRQQGPYQVTYPTVSRHADRGHDCDASMVHKVRQLNIVGDTPAQK